MARTTYDLKAIHMVRKSIRVRGQGTVARSLPLTDSRFLVPVVESLGLVEHLARETTASVTSTMHQSLTMEGTSRRHPKELRTESSVIP
jgi:hypothetical protein